LNLQVRRFFWWYPIEQFGIFVTEQFRPGSAIPAIRTLSHVLAVIQEARIYPKEARTTETNKWQGPEKDS
jgi:hypothetical protein